MEELVTLSLRLGAGAAPWSTVERRTPFPVFPFVGVGLLDITTDNVERVTIDVQLM